MANDTTRQLLANALKRLRELREEYETLQSVVRHYQGVLSAHELLDEQPTFDLVEARNSRKVRSAHVAQLIREAGRIIVGEGRPMTRSELVRRLEDDGYFVEGTDKAKVLGTNLWRSGQFEHIEGKGYWPKDTPRPARR